MFLLGIIILTVVISAVAWKSPTQFQHFLFSPARILGGREYYRMVSSAFIHVDVPHLLFNMYSLYAFAAYLEVRYSAAAFAVLYLLSILGGSALSLLMHRNDPFYTAAGASGGVSGIIFASLFLLPYSSISLLFIPIGIPDYLFAFIFIGVSIYGMRNKSGNIGHDAHLGGALTGMLSVALFYPELIWQRVWLFAGLFIFTVVLTGVYLKESLDLQHVSLNPFPQRKSKPQSSPKPKKQLPLEERLKTSRGRERYINELLDRVSVEGMDSLTPEDRALLNQHAAKLQNRRNP
ncbi:rhomboid family intramembrane serine protease [Cerasicoccus frondis]|uniref:rhomboid family intramembrane serine protease n=1 Tax=Cerasicoccus frondis TaxID=490090 RepID=UPI002852B300|nr:rhomboid family intramembrane serine protease [Cerasicoccus frondis]